MYYKFALNPYHLLTANAVNPLSLREPVVIVHDAFDVNRPELKRLIEETKIKAQTIPYSATYNKGNITGQNPNVRNSRSAQVDQIPEYILDAIQEIAEYAWGRYSFSYHSPTPGALQFLVYTGEDKGFFVPHFDQGLGYNGQLWYNTPERQLTVLAYPNDDYIGGELRFPYIHDEQGRPLTIKPRAGDIIAFPPNPQYTHEVLPVTSGTRIAFSQWFDDIEFFRDLGDLSSNWVQILSPLLANGFVYGHRSLQKDEFSIEKDNYYWTKQFAADSTNPKEFDVEIELGKNYPHLLHLWNTFSNSQFAFGHKLQRVYANLHTYGIEGSLHRDATSRSHYTTLIYAVNEWKPEWLGATLFFDKNYPDRISRAVNPAPWRVIQFRGDMPHIATAVHRSCKAARITLMFKSVSTVELPPDARPPFDYKSSVQTGYLSHFQECKPCAARQKEKSV